jgi:hypothetical protein
VYMHTFIFALVMKKTWLFGLFKKYTRKQIIVKKGESILIKYHNKDKPHELFFVGGPGSWVQEIRCDEENVLIDIAQKDHELSVESYTKTVNASTIVDVWKTDSEEAKDALLKGLGLS